LVYPGTFSTLARGHSGGDWLEVDRRARQVRFLARAHPDRFDEGRRLYHLIASRGGGEHTRSLFTTQVSEQQIHQALIEVGAVPGDNLTKETYTQRRNPKSAEPDKRVEGSRLSLAIQTDSTTWLGVEDILEDPRGKPFSFRFGGHLELIPQWQSGCVVCLVSCPGGRVGNEAYTVRDWELGRARLSLRRNVPLREGQEVVISLGVVEE
jgi:hypothetical protein